MLAVASDLGTNALLPNVYPDGFVDVVAADGAVVGDVYEAPL